MSAQVWHAKFKDFCAYMRGRGWKMPFLMYGNVFLPIGVMADRELRAANE